MGKVKVVTDSCSGFPPELAEDRGVAVIPLTVRFGDKTFRDGVDMTAEEFYRHLPSAPELPKTSQPSVAEFRELFDRLAGHGDTAGILVVTLSHKLSGTYQSAVQAAREFNRVPVEVVDSMSASVPQTFAALAAARAADRGAGLREAAAAAREVAARSRLYATLETLEYLRRGGRIGRAAAWAGAVLQIKPVITIDGGEVAPAARLRTRAKAVEFILDRLGDEIKPDRPLHAGIIHASSPQEAADLAGEVRRRFQPEEIIISGLTPVLGTHAGPGALGVAYYQD
ncbi:MAG: DegV family protein [Bacillota bacterium]|nr:DegV family protein [Bacillota bacterium]